jgi:hypothetical protein
LRENYCHVVLGRSISPSFRFRLQSCRSGLPCASFLLPPGRTQSNRSSQIDLEWRERRSRDLYTEKKCLGAGGRRGFAGIYSANTRSRGRPLEQFRIHAQASRAVLHPSTGQRPSSSATTYTRVDEGLASNNTRLSRSRGGRGFHRGAVCSPRGVSVG